MWLLTQSKNSISTQAMAMARRIGVKWDSAALLRHKLMSVMAEQEADRVLDGGEIDDAAPTCPQCLANSRRPPSDPPRTPATRS